MAIGVPAPIAVPPVPGFRIATAACGIKPGGQSDLLLVEMTASTVAGVFTRNQVIAAPVTLCLDRLPHGLARGLLVNSGNANAANGPRGMANALNLSRAAAKALGVPEEYIFLASTGTIGQQLPVDRPLQAIPAMKNQMKASAWQQAATAIMTTDTFAKVAHRQFNLNGKSATLAGIAKGAGMIHPNMATMLAFLFTDAAVSAPTLQTLLERAVATSFNSISVDGDTSTNDTMLAFASGVAGNPSLEEPDDPRAAPLADALTGLCTTLAQYVVRDGEGASKFITITVSGAQNPDAAKKTAMSVAKSPLVKTACAGSDPNWGRILAAVGNAEVPLVVDRISIHLGEHLVVANGIRAPGYTEKKGQEVMNREEITIHINLGQGNASHTVWTCDLTHDYITINADYRT